MLTRHKLETINSKLAEYDRLNMATLRLRNGGSAVVLEVSGHDAIGSRGVTPVRIPAALLIPVFEVMVAQLYDELDRLGVEPIDKDRKIAGQQ